jgi:hypothetical protein
MEYKSAKEESSHEEPNEEPKQVDTSERSARGLCLAGCGAE